MAVSIDQKVAVPAGSRSQRESARLFMSIPITLTGKDKDGRDFRENTRTLIVNRHGAKVVSAFQPASGAEILVENRSLGRIAKASVVWVGEKIEGTDSAEIGLQLVTADNLWGLEFPPDETGESSLRGNGSGAKPEAVPSATKTGAAAADEDSERNAAEAAKFKALFASPSDVAPTAELADAGASAFPSKYRKQIEEAAQAALVSFGENLTKLSKQAGWSTQLSLQDSGKQIEEKTRSSLKRAFDELTETAENSRAALVAALTEARQLQEGWESQTQNMQQKVQSAGRQALQAATQAFSEQLNKEAESAIAHAVSEIHRRQAEAVEQAKAQLDHLVESGTTWLLDDVNKVGEAAISQFHRELEGSIEKTGAEVLKSVQEQAQSVTDQAVARLQVRVDSVERVFKNSKEEIEKHLADISESLLDAFRSQAKSLLQPFPGKLQDMVRACEEKAKAELPERLKGATDNLIGTLAKRLEKETDAATRLVTERRTKEFDAHLRKTAEELMEDSAAQMRKLEQDALDLIGVQLNEKQAQVVTQAVESFRTKVGKMLSVFQSEGKKDA